MELQEKDLIEEKSGSEDIFDGTLLHVKRDTVKLPNGGTATREWIKHPGASAVIPLLDDGQVILVKQYRYPIGRITLEIPAGKLDAPDEDPLLCATRELSEETGYQAENITKLTTVATTVGFSNEYIHIYAATGLTAGKQHTDEDEFINVVKMPLSQAVELVLKGEIYDAKSVAAILLLERSQKENANV
jgi:ADP-ribose pyrophosphatase